MGPGAGQQLVDQLTVSRSRTSAGSSSSGSRPASARATSASLRSPFGLAALALIQLDPALRVPYGHHAPIGSRLHKSSDTPRRALVERVTPHGSPRSAGAVANSTAVRRHTVAPERRPAVQRSECRPRPSRDYVPVWVPATAEQIEAAAVAGDLPETSRFDTKRGLPATWKKNADLATDVAAMATDGGVLLYGVAEDEHERATIPAPFRLAGASDRIGQIVSTGIAEVPYIDVREYARAEDPSIGYVAVIVPQSARAPHQVTIGGNLRFYGRGAKGNRPLTEGDVARLYERRQSWAVDRDRVLADVIAHAPFPEREGFGYMHAFTRPVAPDKAMFECATDAIGSHQDVHQRLLNTIHSTTLRGQYGPSLEQAQFFERRGADDWRFSNTSEQYDDLGDPGVVRDAVFLGLNIDGSGQLLCGRATDTRLTDDKPVIIEVVIAGNLEAFFAVMAMIYEAAGYYGHVDVGVAITGLQGAGSERRNRGFGGDHFAYSMPRFSRTDRLPLAELGAPAEVAHGLLRNFYEATTGITGYNPFTQPSNH